MVETRKLAAILVSDVVGYSRLAGADEDRILARLRALRSDLIDPIIAVHYGRVVKRTGDGAIVEFRSVEVYLGDRWYTFDARHNEPRIGRILMARGRDATDVAISTSFGPCVLTGFKVVTDEVPAQAAA